MAIFSNAFTWHIEERNHYRWIKTVKKVRIDRGQANRPGLIDEKCSCHRQFPRIIAVVRG